MAAVGGASLGVALVTFLIVGSLMVSVVLILSWCVRPLRRRPESETTYECGFPAEGDKRAIGFGYFTYAALFLLFDLAVLYLYLYATNKTIWSSTWGWFIGGLAILLVAIAASRRGVMPDAA